MTPPAPPARLPLQHRASQVVLAWPFLVSLAVLLLNDCILKYEYPGWLTGKLSDFAGLFLVGGLVVIAAPRRPAWVLLVLAAMFVWWKSPASRGFIELVNIAEAAGIRVVRTMDMTDLVALPALALGFAVLERRVLDSPRDVRRVATALCGAAVMVAITGTSAIRIVQEMSVRAVAPEGQVDLAQAKTIIEQIATEHRFTPCAQCPVSDSVVFERADGGRVIYTALPDNRGIRLIVDVGHTPLFFSPKKRKEELNAIQVELFKQLSAVFPDGEFILDMQP